jgi:aspartyl-tRNA(Asn)/glutamyl-tRNA(Gln) amidotransferase subunit B
MYGFSKYDTDILVSDKKLANYAEEVISELKEWINTERPKDRGVTWHTHKEEFIKLVANWLIHRLLALLNAQHLDIKESKVTPENFAELITLIYEKRVNQQTAQKVLEEMFKTGGDPSNIIEEKKLGQIFDENALGKIIDEVIKENPEVVQEYKSGKAAALQFLMGQVMRKTKGQAEPKILNDLLVHKLK